MMIASEVPLSKIFDKTYVAALHETLDQMRLTAASEWFGLVGLQIVIFQQTQNSLHIPFSPMY